MGEDRRRDYGQADVKAAWTEIFNRLSSRESAVVGRWAVRLARPRKSRPTQNYESDLLTFCTSLTPIIRAADDIIADPKTPEGISRVAQDISSDLRVAADPFGQLDARRSVRWAEHGDQSHLSDWDDLVSGVLMVLAVVGGGIALTAKSITVQVMAAVTGVGATAAEGMRRIGHGAAGIRGRIERSQERERMRRIAKEIDQEIER